MDLNYLYRETPGLAVQGGARVLGPGSLGSWRICRFVCRAHRGSEAVPHTSASSVMQQPTRGEAADELREQAASCRSLPAGADYGRVIALNTVAEHFDDDVRRIDPLSEKR